MVYASDSQRKFFNANKGTKVPANVVDEFNEASRGKKLPKKAKKKSLGQLPILKSNGMAGLTTTSGGQGVVTVGMGSYPALRERKKKKMRKSVMQNMIDQKITNFFAENPYADDDEVHEFAKEQGMMPDEFETLIYKYVSSFLCEGKSKNSSPVIDPKELDMGIEVEYEHTTNKCIAMKIATDHLTEIPDYYSRLAKMEEQAKKDGKFNS